MKIRVTQKDLQNAVADGIVSGEQAVKLWERFIAGSATKPAFTGVNVAYYLGALIVVSAMTWFATEAFSRFQGLGLAVIALLYFAGFTVAGITLYRREHTAIPGGLLLTVAVFMMPLLVFSIQKYLDVWVFKAPGDYNDYYLWIRSGWFFMELATIMVSVTYLIVFRFPFITFPLAFTLWFLSMDLTPILLGMDNFSFDQRKLVSMIFGLGMLVVTYCIDRKTKRDFAFWLYLFGLAAFWSGLSLMDSNSEISKFLYCCINLFLILVAVLFQRRVFLVFGAAGVWGYLFHLSSVVFKDSLVFPVALSLLGILIIWSGIMYNRHRARIEKALIDSLPPAILKVLPPYR